MQRISVDLPDPEGPQMTIRSPRKTVRLMSRRTWKSLYHLFMPTIWIAASSSFDRSAAKARFSFFTLLTSSLAFGGDPLFDEYRIARHAEAEAPIDDRHSEIAGGC